MDSQFTNELIFISIVWLSFALVTGYISKRRDKSFLYGFFIGCVFGIFGIILILLLPKSKKKYVLHEDDRLDSRLKYYKIKEEFEEYKRKQEEKNKS
ncbi:MAG: hypothetical protein ACHQJ4_03480 [Ignavibacteria bacterium]